MTGQQAAGCSAGTHLDGAGGGNTAQNRGTFTTPGGSMLTLWKAEG